MINSEQDIVQTRVNITEIPSGLNESMITLKYDVNTIPRSLLSKVFEIRGFSLMFGLRHPDTIVQLVNPEKSIENAITLFKDNFGENIYVYIYNPLSILERLSRSGHKGDFTTVNLAEFEDMNLARDLLILNLTLRQRTDYFTNIKRWNLPLDPFHSNLDWSPYDYNGNTLFYSVVTETGVVVASSRTVLPSNRNMYSEELIGHVLQGASYDNDEYFNSAVKYLENINLLGFQELGALKRTNDYRKEVIDLALSIITGKFCSIERLCSSPELGRVAKDKLTLMLLNRICTLYAEMSMANVMELMGKTQWLFQTDPTFSNIIELYYKGSTRKLWETKQQRYSPEGDKLIPDKCISIMLDLSTAWSVIDKNWKEYFKSYKEMANGMQMPLNYIINKVPLTL